MKPEVLGATFAAPAHLEAPPTGEHAGAPCRSCATPLRHTFVDLGMSPLCESYIDRASLNSMEPFYPLHVSVCHACFLVQLDQYVTPEHIFTEYAYFSSYADSWVEHARQYVDRVSQRLDLTSHSRVVEIASNDGYLLQHFVARGIPVLGVDPAANVARAAIAKGVPTIVRFFGAAAATDITREHGGADLIVANNVLAHVPDIRDFVHGLRLLLNPSGTLTLEFPHLVRLMEGNQFDTIYHEHFSYLSLLAVQPLLRAYGLRVYDVEELSTHGGSLRLYVCHDAAALPTQPSVPVLLEREDAYGLRRPETYARFGDQVVETKRRLLSFLIGARQEGKTIAGYGAPGKGNTLLNYCGIRTDFLDYTVDRNPYKQGKFLPGTRIPIHPPDRIRETRPDFVLILPWNLRSEIAHQLAYIREWGGCFVVPIPQVEVF
jgi:SAM-dependent methyltransferase